MSHQVRFLKPPRQQPTHHIVHTAPAKCLAAGKACRCFHPRTSSHYVQRKQRHITFRNISAALHLDSLGEGGVEEGVGGIQGTRKGVGATQATQAIMQSPHRNKKDHLKSSQVKSTPQPPHTPLPLHHLKLLQ
jgi:hypothetical protein